MFKRLILAVLFLAASRVEAIDYSDVYSVPTEAGWGLFLAQSETFQFLAFYIYGQDGKPTWYTAQLTQDATGKFTGELYATTGTYYGLPWNPAGRGIQQVGTATFQPTSPTTATLTYVLTGGPTVVKQVQRHTFTPFVLSGSYVGGQAGRYSGCTNPAVNVPYTDAFLLDVTQAGGVATLQFTYNNGLVCTLSGPLAQAGTLHSIGAATYSCNDGLQTTAGMSEIKATSLGIEGRFTAASVGQGCREDAQFSAVLK